MPTDCRGKNYPNHETSDVLYVKSNWYHVTNPPKDWEYLPSHFDPKYLPRLPLKRLLRYMILKIVEKRSGPGVDKMMAWAKKKGSAMLENARYYRKCPHSGKWSNNNFGTVITKDDKGREVRQDWCDSAMRVDAFFCYQKRMHLDRAKFDHIYIEDSQHFVCDEYKSSYHFWEDGWHAQTKEYADNELRIYKERAKEGGGIPSYHGLRPSWRNKRVTGGDVLIGVELEVFSKVNRREVCDDVEAVDFIGETDGSLDHSRGIEIVSKPLSYKNIRDPQGPWMNLLGKVKEKCSPGGTGYGMHISVSRGAMAKDHQIRFCCFIHRNKAMCEKVGERAYHYDPERPLDDSTLALSRSAAGPVGEHRIEVRLFKSVTEPKDFLRNVGFTSAIVDYTRDCDPKDLTEPKFLSWLGGRRAEFPETAEFLLGKKPEKTPPKRIRKFGVKKPNIIPQPVRVG